MPYPYRGFSLWGPAVQPAPPAPPFTIADNAIKQAQIGANVGRYNLYWSAIQPDISSPWDSTPINVLKLIIAAAKQHNPDYRAVIMLDGIPTGVPGRAATGHWVNNDAGADQYGIAVGRIMSELDGYCDFIELGNEVNQLEWAYRNGSWVQVNPTAGAIPPEDYGRMVAYAAHWVGQCCGFNNESSILSTPKKKVLAGAMALRGQSDTWVQNFPPLTYAVKMADAINTYLYLLDYQDNAKKNGLQQSWRMSLHPYPRLGSDEPGNYRWNHSNHTGDWTGTYAMGTVYNDWDDFRQSFPNRKIWFTETGVSSMKVLDSGQELFMLFLYNLVNDYSPWLEGIINFGFTDLDPAVWSPTNDSGTGGNSFYRMGVLSHVDGVTKKPAGTKVQQLWANWP